LIRSGRDGRFTGDFFIPYFIFQDIALEEIVNV
jgi:hypothetical protein